MKIEECLAIVETEVKGVKEDIEKMVSNDIPHLVKAARETNEEVNKINTNFKIYKAKSAIWAGIGIFIATFLAQILIKLFVQ